MHIHMNWLTALLAGLWSSSGLLVFNAVLVPNIGDSSRSETVVWMALTIVFVVIPLQVGVIGRQPRYAESLAYGAPSEQARCGALVGRCLMWLISAIASGYLFWGVTQAFAINLLA
jgi:RsiW-degrading membrane proteinase PrsW (M82 family)